MTTLSTVSITLEKISRMWIRIVQSHLGLVRLQFQQLQTSISTDMALYSVRWLYDQLDKWSTSG